MSAVISKYPLDFDSLKKGDIIGVDTIENLTNCKVGTEAYQLQVLSLQARIENELAMRGLLVTVKAFKHSLKILTDAEAAIYNAKRFENELRALGRVHNRKAVVDISQLDETQKAKHERELLNQGRYIQAIGGVSRQIRAEAHKRILPNATEN